MLIPYRPHTPESARTLTAIHRAQLVEMQTALNNLKTDTDRAIRVRKRLCQWCYYRPLGEKVGGAALTTHYCGICQKEALAGSTAVDQLCRECSCRHALCKACGGDLHMRRKRKHKWEGGK